MSQLVRTPDGMRYVDLLEARISSLERQLAGSWIPVLDALPSGPTTDGREIYFRFEQSVNPVDASVLLWHLRWDAAADAWLPVGRQEPVYARHGTNESAVFSANTWGGINANDPKATVPLAGDYDVSWGLGMALLSVATNYWVGLRVGGVEPGAVAVGTNPIVAGADNGAAIWSSSGPGEFKMDDLAAATLIEHRYYIQAAGTVHRGAAYLKLYPRKLTA